VLPRPAKVEDLHHPAPVAPPATRHGVRIEAGTAALLAVFPAEGR
jgi:hypothetical protein